MTDLDETQKQAGHRDPVVSRVPFFYGWVMLPVAMLTQMATSPGQTFGVASSSFGPFAMGLAYDWLGGYSEILWVFFGIVAATIVAGLFATRPALPRGDHR